MSTTAESVSPGPAEDVRKDRECVSANPESVNGEGHPWIVELMRDSWIREVSTSESTSAFMCEHFVSLLFSESVTIVTFTDLNCLKYEQTVFF